LKPPENPRVRLPTRLAGRKTHGRKEEREAVPRAPGWGAAPGTKRTPRLTPLGARLEAVFNE
jgi:hypothetical protein